MVAGAQTAAPPATSKTGLEEVTITSTRQSNQTLLTAPAAVAAFSAQQIEDAGITRPKDFLALTPNVSLIETNNASESFIVIRGEAPSRNAEGSVSVVIDGVQQASANEFNADLFDIEHIEVLKGPQSALYGRNSVGGAIVIDTKQPTNTYEGWFTAGVANGPGNKEQFSVGGPIIDDKLLFKIDGSHRETDGYRANVNTGEKGDRQENFTGRVLFVWKPTDNTKVDIRAGATDLTGGGIDWVAQAGAPFNSLIPSAAVDPYDQAAKCMTTLDTNNTCSQPTQRTKTFDRLNKNNASVRVDQQLPWGEVYSTTAYSFIRDIYGAANFPYFFQAGPLDSPLENQWVYLDNEAYTEEVRFVSPSDLPVRFQTGVYGLYEQSDRKTNITLDGNGLIYSGQSPALVGPDTSLSYRFDRSRSEDYAAFLSVDVDLMKDLLLTLAIRYDEEFTSIADHAPAPFSLHPGESAKATYTKPQPKATLRYNVTDQASVYGSFSEGFKAGGFNPFNSHYLAVTASPVAGAVIEDSYGKESTRDLELGFHSRWFNDKLSLDGAVFYSQAANDQVFAFFPAPSLQANVAVDKADKKGYELAANYATPIPGLSLNAAYGYALSTVAEFRACPACVGDRMPFVPHDQTTAGVQYRTAVNNLVPRINRDDLTALIRLDGQRLGTTAFDIFNDPGSARSPITLINAHFAIESDRWTFSAWGKNITNKQYADEQIVLYPALGVIHKALPATYGADLTWKF